MTWQTRAAPGAPDGLFLLFCVLFTLVFTVFLIIMAVLIGVLSGSYRRRVALRCSFRVQQCVACRWLFIVGDPANGGAPGDADLDAGDVLHARGVREAQQLYLHGYNRTARPGERGGTLTGTLTGLLKLSPLLKHAAMQREPYLAVAEDDTFVSLHALEAYATALQLQPGGRRMYYAGVFEYVSLLPAQLTATSWGLSHNMARARGRRRNCTEAPSTSSGIAGLLPWSRRQCVGPFPFAKGPLMLLSRGTVQALVEETTFESDVANASERALRLQSEGLRPMIHHDIHLGAWLHQLRSRITYVAIQRSGKTEPTFGPWRGTWTRSSVVVDPASLLSIHKLPWGCRPRLLANIAAAWLRHADGAPPLNASLSARCRPCEGCAAIRATSVARCMHTTFLVHTGPPSTAGMAGAAGRAPAAQGFRCDSRFRPGGQDDSTCLRTRVTRASESQFAEVRRRGVCGAFSIGDGTRQHKGLRARCQ